MQKQALANVHFLYHSQHFKYRHQLQPTKLAVSFDNGAAKDYDFYSWFLSLDCCSR